MGFATPKAGPKRAKGNVSNINFSNTSHRASTDPEALLARKSKAHPAPLSDRFQERISRYIEMGSWTTVLISWWIAL